MTKIHRRASMILAAVAGITLTAGGATANDDDYTSSFVDNDAEIYGYYDAGFDDVNANDDWFYDYYGLQSDLGDEYWTASDDWDTDWGEGDATDLGDDDAGEEGIFDF